MSYYVGLDVALRSLALCVINGDGGIVLERALDCDVNQVADCIRALGKPITMIGFEAGTMSQHLYHGLRAEGFDVVCMEARQVSAALSAMRNKTDKNDARGIAQLVRSGWYNPVHMKGRTSHLERALPTGSSSPGRGSRMKPIMSAAPLSASQSEALRDQSNPCMQRLI